MPTRKTKEAPAEPHPICNWAENRDVHIIRVLRRNIPLEDFDAGVSLTELEAFCQKHGAGRYTINAFDDRNERIKGYRLLNIAAPEGETLPENLLRAAPAPPSGPSESTQMLDFLKAQMETMRLERTQLMEQMSILRSEMSGQSSQVSKDEQKTMREWLAQQQQAKDAEAERARLREERMRQEEERRRDEHEERLMRLRQQELQLITGQATRSEHAAREEIREREARMQRELERQLALLRGQYEQQLAFERSQAEQRIEMLKVEYDHRLEAVEERWQDRMMLQERDHKLKLERAETKLQNEYGFGQQGLPKGIKEQYWQRMLDLKFPEPTALDRFLEQVQPIVEGFQSMQQGGALTPPNGAGGFGVPVGPAGQLPEGPGFEDNLPDVIDMDAA